MLFRSAIKGNARPEVDEWKGRRGKMGQMSMSVLLRQNGSQASGGIRILQVKRKDDNGVTTAWGM